MLFNRLRIIAQLIGYAGFLLLAVQGTLSILQGNVVWAAIADPTDTATVQTSSLPEVQQTGVTTHTVPERVNYQGTLKDKDGNPLDGDYAMTFRIYDDVKAPITDARWSEPHPNVTVRNGSFSVLLGDSNPILPSVFTNPDRFIGVTVDPYDEMVPRQRFTTVAYAFQADRASGLFASDGNSVDEVTLDGNDNIFYLDIRSSDKDAAIRLFDDADYWSIHNDDQDSNEFDVRYNNSSKMQLSTDGTITSAGDGIYKGGDVSVWYGTKALTLRQGSDNSIISNKNNFHDNGADSNGFLFLNGSRGVQLNYGDDQAFGNPGLTLDNTGRVGIGTTNPSQKLDVNGSANVNGNIAWSGHLSNLSVSEEFSWGVGDGRHWTTSGYFLRDSATGLLYDSNNSMCFLVYVELEDVDSTEEKAGCYVRAREGKWELVAEALGDSNANCRARCLKW